MSDPSDSQSSDRQEQPESKTARWIAVGVGVLVVALIALLAIGGGGPDQAASRLIDKRVPEVSGPTMDGGSFDIDDHRGRWVLVNFFATWCVACVAEHPDLVQLSEWGQANGGLDVVSVVFNDEPDEVQAFFNDRGGSWPVLSDPGMAIDFQVSQVPETFVVSPEGVVVAHLVGGITAEEVIEMISR